MSYCPGLSGPVRDLDYNIKTFIVLKIHTTEVSCHSYG
jgi:hypothetical protein